MELMKVLSCVRSGFVQNKGITFKSMNQYQKQIITGLLLLLFNADTKAQPAQPDGYTDHHVHLQDSATVQLGYRMLKAIGQAPTKVDSIVFDADTIIERLNRAQFKNAWLLSNAYWFGSPLTPIENEYEAVKKQNDWTAAQAARYPGRLSAFMSVNPLKPYALEEIQRCADSKRFTGLKLHFANSKIDLFDTAQVSQLQKVFALANKNDLLMIIHFRSGQQWNGKANTQILLNQLLPFAKNTKVIIAHMAGWGGYDKPMDTALNLLAAYIHKNNQYSKNLYLELSAVLPLTLNEDYKPATSKRDWDPVKSLKKRIRKIGADHILFGTDWPLIDIDPYIGLLNEALGEAIVQQILRNRITYE
ncbi:MAG: amidohydrolase family protein [Chitinophagaceae bacterium]|nr:amidohydrolase family protein [Chitinophagaceae bacterium]